jgi:hypothetical protein
MKMDRTWLLRLYPRAWRDRYQDEFVALLEQCPFSLGDVFDIIAGAIDAHLHACVPLQAGITFMIQRLRGAMILGLCAAISFFGAGVTFEETAYDDYFVSLTAYLPRFYPVYPVFSLLIDIGVTVALIALLVGGLPIAWTVIRHAGSVARKELLFWAVPLCSFAVLLPGSYVLLAVEDTRIALPASVAALLGVTYLVMLVGASIASSAAVARAVTGSTVSEHRLHFALICATVATGAMGLTLVAIIVWGVFLNMEAAWLFTSGIDYYRVNAFALGSMTLVDAWLGWVVVMAVSTGCAALSLIRARSIVMAPHRLV